MATNISGSTGVSKVQDGTVTSAKIVDGAITNADINTSAAIAGTKISGSFGKVLQVKLQQDSLILSLQSASYTDTGLSISITPSSTSSKILAMWNVQGDLGVAGAGWGTQLVRGSTNIFTSSVKYAIYNPASGGLRAHANYNQIDSPNTTSAVTYKVQVASYDGKIVHFNGDGAQTQLVLMEIAG